jgi:hypothetical protein
MLSCRENNPVVIIKGSGATNRIAEIETQFLGEIRL